MKRILTIIALATCISASAQTSSYRETGYKGNVYALTTFGGCGVGTSHGYMFNEKHYLGASVDMEVYVYSVMNRFEFQFGYASIDYLAYLSKKSSTPVAGLRAGYVLGHYKYSKNLLHGFRIEPQIGWSWEQRSGKGVTLALGAQLMREKDTLVPVSDPMCCEVWGIGLPVAPTISLAFEF